MFFMMSGIFSNLFENLLKFVVQIRRIIFINQNCMSAQFQRTSMSHKSIILSLALIALSLITCDSQITTVGSLFEIINQGKKIPENCSVFKGGVCMRCKNNFQLNEGICILMGTNPTPQPVPSSNPQTNKQPQKVSYLQKIPKQLPPEQGLPCGTERFCGEGKNFNSPEQITKLITESPGGLSETAQIVTSMTQEPDIEEADLIQTDGNYIYTFSRAIFSIIRISRGNQGAKVVYAEPLSRNRPQAMFISGGYLAIFGTNFRTAQSPLHSYAFIYDIKNPQSPRRINQLAFEGRYTDARMNDEGYVYMISKQDPEKRQNPVPRFNLNDKYGWKHIPTQAVFFFPGEYRSPRFINLFVFNINDPLEKLKMNMVSAVVDNAHDLYHTRGSLYITVTRYVVDRQYTIIHKVFLQDYFIVPFADARAVGRIQNQFSMFQEPYQNYFRIITSSKDTPADSRGIYITTFDKDLYESRLIYSQGDQVVSSARFTKNRLYYSTIFNRGRIFCVQFENQTPYIRSSFVSDREFSYLQPYTDDILIGLGREDDGNGLSIVLINVKNPYELTLISDFSAGRQEKQSYAFSGAQFEHKAFLVIPNYSVLIIPIKVNQAGNLFNGAFVFSLKNSQVSLIALIDHLIDPRITGELTDVERSFSIGNRLYTKSPCIIRVNSLETFAGIENIRIPCSTSDIQNLI